MIGKRYRRAPSALFRRYADEVLLASADGEGFQSMSGPAADVWDLLDGSRSVTELALELAPAYATPPDVIEGDLVSLLEDLRRRGFAEEVPGSHG